jgi:hypothetical protein
MSAGTEGVHLPGHLREAIRDRGQPISLTRSKYLRLIVEWWDQQGRPPVNAADAAMLQIQSLKVADPKASAHGKTKKA